MKALAPGRSWDLLAIPLLFVVTFVLCDPGARDASFVLQLGPNDHVYLSGFASHYEVADGVAARWTSYEARIEIPLLLEGGPSELSYRFSRVFAETASVAVSLAGSTIDRFDARGGEIATRRVRLPPLSGKPISIGIDVDSHERRNLGLRMDWLRLDTGESGRLRPRGFVRFFLPLFSSLVFVLLRWGGLSRAVSVLATCLWIAVAFAWMRRDPFGFLHVSGRVGIAALSLTTLAAAILRRMPAGRWVVPLFLLGYLLKASVLFLPTTFYPDVANARDYVEAFRGTEGSLAERGVQTQTLTNVGYPRNVGGKDYAFPYSPLYFLPFGALSDPGHIEDAVRHVGLAAASLAVLPLFWIGATSFGPRVGALAALLWAFMPPIFSRLLLALHATLVGNFLDLVVIAAVIALARKPESFRRTALVAGTMLASLLVYTSSLFSIGAFVLFASALERRLAPRLLPMFAACGLLTIGWLYRPFVVTFFTEIAPAIASGGGGPAEGGGAGVQEAFRRIPLFYGALYPLLAGAGWVLARRRADPRVFRLLLAYGFAFALMLALRAFGAGLFKDLKEITFVAPLVALLSGATLDALSRRGPTGTVLAAFLVGALAWFGAGRLRGYLDAYASPMMTHRVSLGREDPTIASPRAGFRGSRYSGVWTPDP